MIRVRPAEASDVGRVVNDWCRVYRHSVDTRGLADSDFYPRQKALIHAAWPHMEVRIACPEDDEDTVAGWVALSLTSSPLRVLHFIYLRQQVRGMGLASVLLPEHQQIQHYTHRIKRWQKTPPTWRFTPMLFACGSAM